VPFKLAVASIELVSGTEVETPEDGMTVFFGPNNSGKSLLLRELTTELNSSPHGYAPPGKCIAKARLDKQGSLDDLLAELQRRGYQPHRGDDGESYYPGQPGNTSVSYTPAVIQNSWDSNQLGGISHFLWSYQATNDRLGDQTQAASLNDLELPNHPVQLLSDSATEHERFSKMVEHAFGEKISINRYNQLQRLLVGETGLPDEVMPISRELKQAYYRLPTVAEQGDGFRAFVNVLLQSVVRPAPLIIIDEPEAFLHPPQARLLGRYLAEAVPQGSQVFVATHSSDFLAGVIEARSGRPVALVRLANAGGRRSARVLTPDAVAELVDSPLLRYSNIIAGLFHDGVVLCEAATDCQFYAATLDVTHSPSAPRSNLEFLHVNGKDPLADTAEKLRRCGLPVAVIADLDLIREEGKFKAAVERLGGTWSEVESDVKAVNQHAETVVITKPIRVVREDVKAILASAADSAALSQEQAERIRGAVKFESGWAIIKRGGKDALRGQDAYLAIERIIAYAAQLGLFLVPVGELEGWVPRVPSGNKKNWFNRVFTEGHWRNPSDELRAFITAVASHTRG
jgi:predicted ATPase